MKIGHVDGAFFQFPMPPGVPLAFDTVLCLCICPMLGRYIRHPQFCTTLLHSCVLYFFFCVIQRCRKQKVEK